MNLLKSVSARLTTFLNKRIKKTNWYKNQLVDKSQYPTNEWYRFHSERNFDIVNIGSSSALFAFNYQYTNYNGLNWAGRPQSLELGFKLIKNFFSILRKGGAVLIPVSPFTGLYVPWAGQSEEDRFYGIMDYTLFEDYNRVTFKMGNPIRSNPKEAIKRLIKDVAPQREISVKQIDGEDFQDDAVNWINNWKREFGIQDLDASVPDQLKEGMQKRANLMSEIVRFCVERDLRPIIVLAPVHHTLGTYFTEKFRENYLAPILNAAKDGGASIIDLMTSQEFKTSDFYNSFFLNPTGSKKFMKKIGSVIL